MIYKNPKHNTSSEKYLKTDNIIQELNVEIGQTIIDLGCGNGYMAKHFSQLVGTQGKIYAIDKNKNVIDILKMETGNSNIEPIFADVISGLPLNDASIDLIYLSTVFHLFKGEQVKKLNNEITRLLKPNGKLAILNIDKKEMPFGPPYELKVTIAELINLIKITPVKSIKLGEYFYMQIFKK